MLDWLGKFFVIDDVGDETSVPGWCIKSEALQDALTWGKIVDGEAPLLTKWDTTLRTAITAAMQETK